MDTLKSLFFIDALSLIMICLVGFVGFTITFFSKRYLKGDYQRKRFYRNLFTLIPMVFIMVSVDHILLLLAAWASSNFLLTRMMQHKHAWKAARVGARLALINFSIGMVALSSAFALLYQQTGNTSIQLITHSHIAPLPLAIVLGCMLISIMTQSAIWPFHRWLTSASNAPTPVSAIMHAGLVNGGGFMLARFAPLLAQEPLMLQSVFVVGIITALIGTLWKLMQSDVKRMLACSTMGQMGFMVAQCGLGLFGAAVAHLCWHGLAKAYLFLGSGAVAQEKRYNLAYPPTLGEFVVALLIGLLGTFAFCLTSGKSYMATDTTLFLVAIALLASSQFALTIVRNRTFKSLSLALIATPTISALYGFNVSIITKTLNPLHLSVPQPMTMLHIIALFLLTLAWLGVLFGRCPKRQHFPKWVLRLYVAMLNASQPHPKTVTAHRNHYHC